MDGAVVKKFQPSNATQGDSFRASFCNQCKRGGDCEIELNTMLYDIDDPEYPCEWVIQDGRAQCTAFERKEETTITKPECIRDIPDELWHMVMLMARSGNKAFDTTFRENFSRGLMKSPEYYDLCCGICDVMQQMLRKEQSEKKGE